MAQQRKAGGEGGSRCLCDRLCNLGRSGNCQKESRPTDDVRLLSSLSGDSTSFQLIILKQMSAATLDIPPTYLLIDSTMIFQFSVTVLSVLP